MPKGYSCCAPGMDAVLEVEVLLIGVRFIKAAGTKKIPPHARAVTSQLAGICSSALFGRALDR